jgi:hypothetical protein
MITPTSVSPIALRVEITTAKATFDDVRHEAILLASRLATPIAFRYGETNYLLSAFDNCPPTCPLCEGRNPQLTPTVRELSWEAA